MFRWIDCTDPTRPRTLKRAPSVRLRMAQLTDPHVPGDIPLMRRLRDLMRAHRNIGQLSHEVSAISNEFSHPYRKDRRTFTNLLKKALVGLHKLGVDHLLLTGDVAHCGMPAEFLEIKGVLGLTGWSSPQKMTIIPGNHDRFNLYESIPGESMEAFFDVVHARAPRIKHLDHGVSLIELDSNCDRQDDRHYLERWLPNTVGRIYPETLEWLETQRASLQGRHVVVLMHHHLTTDWYAPNPVRDFGGVMNPAHGADALVDWVDTIDPHAVILHGHIHDAMPVGYTYKNHWLGNPGGFAQSMRVNLVDVTDEAVMHMTQIQLRT